VSVLTYVHRYMCMCILAQLFVDVLIILAYSDIWSGVAAISRLNNIIGFSCKRAL